MKGLFYFLATLCCLSFADEALARGNSSHSGTTSVRSYRRRNGIIVPPHRRTRANSTKSDNWSTKGNINPDTGKPGNK